MFQDEEHESVLLGRLDAAVSKDDDPYASKVGGEPVWLKNNEAKVPCCAVCGLRMLFVMQVYAPINYERVLYVFCCSSSSCADESKGWCVLRQQLAGWRTDEQAAAKQQGSEATIQPSFPNAAGPAPSAASASTNGGLEGDAASTGGGWGTSSWKQQPVEFGAAAAGSKTTGAGGAKSVMDLASLLAARDASLVPAEGVYKVANVDKDSVAISAGGTPEPKKGARGEETGAAVPSLEHPCYRARYLVVEEEPWAEVPAKYAGRGVDEDEPDDLKDDKGEHRDKGMSGGDEGDGGGETYERVPLDKRYLLTFQDRVARSPHQCLRYAYGGHPLWPSPPPPPLKENADKSGRRSRGDTRTGAIASPSVSPRCGACGGPRSFELQLMPSLLFLLGPVLGDKSGKDNSTDSASGKPLLAGEGPTKDVTASALEDGACDWGSVMVYSCEASCEEGGEEYAWVHPWD